MKKFNVYLFLIYLLLFGNTRISHAILFEGHDYVFVNLESLNLGPNGADIFEATQHMSDMYGSNYHLATITSQAEMNFIINLLSSNESRVRVNYYLGGFQDNGETNRYANWQWVTGESWSYTSWENGEPNDFYGTASEQILTIRYNQGGWNWNDAPESPQAGGYVAGYIAESGSPVPIEPGGLLTDLGPFELVSGTHPGAIRVQESNINIRWGGTKGASNFKAAFVLRATEGNFPNALIVTLSWGGGNMSGQGEISSRGFATQWNAVNIFTITGARLVALNPVTTGRIQCGDNWGWWSNTADCRKVWGATATVSHDAGQPPIADAGPDQTVIIGELVSFDGSYSYDPDGEIVSFDWDFDDGYGDSGETVDYAYDAAGEYVVTLTVTDDDGATGDDTVTITVLTPEEATADLIAVIEEELNLPKGIENSLTSKLEGMLDSLANGEDKEATNQLNAFINQVNAQRGKKVSEEVAEALIEYAEAIIDSTNF